MDLTVTSYATWDDLCGYMDGSAAVIGEMMLPILEPIDGRRRSSDARDLGDGCRFQLTNFLRDVAEDLDLRAAMYLPQEGPATASAPTPRAPLGGGRTVAAADALRDRPAAGRCTASGRSWASPLLPPVNGALHRAPPEPCSTPRSSTGSRRARLRRLHAASQRADVAQGDACGPAPALHAVTGYRGRDRRRHRPSWWADSRAQRHSSAAPVAPRRGRRRARSARLVGSVGRGDPVPAGTRPRACPARCSRSLQRQSRRPLRGAGGGRRADRRRRRRSPGRPAATSR